MVVKEDIDIQAVGPFTALGPTNIGGCVQDGIPDAGSAPSGGSEFSPRVRRILEAQPLSPLRKAILSGPANFSAGGSETPADGVMQASVAPLSPGPVSATVPISYTPQSEEKVPIVKRSSLP